MARYLTTEQHLLELAHFMPEAGASIGSFVQTFRLSKLQAYRKVQHLLEMGLLVVTSAQPRRGKPIKLYRCPYHSFFVPSRVISPAEFVADQRHNAQMNAAVDTALGEMRIAGLMMSPQANGTIQVLLVDAAHQPINPFASKEAALFLNVGALTLDFEDAKALQSELQALIERYSSRRGSGHYLYQLFVTPICTHSSNS